ncbi:MAG: glycosyltransferase [Candidatus Omnitrophica bacterium]|nr:glycosyltransferase [Candidatus Omnitrophota bacterium]
MNLISVITPCYNEEKNVEDLYLQVKAVFQGLKYQYEHIFIDNASTDGTITILKRLAQADNNLKIIINSKNFGWVRSPFYGMLQGHGAAVVLLASDLQDPPGLIIEFIKKWEEGYKIVLGVKTKSKEPALIYKARSLYYGLYNKLSENEIVRHSTGFGLYDKTIIEIFRQLKEPYPFLKSLIPEIGFKKATVEYIQEKREKGISSSSLYRLYDVAIHGIISDSRVLIRGATLFGFLASALSLLIAIAYLILKITLWERFQLGIASVAIGVFFFASVQLFFIGIIGEYVGAIYTHVKDRPLVIEKERINF